MNFLVDHDVYFMTVLFLRQEGHDVITAKELSMHEAGDADLLSTAKTLDRIFMSRDKDFGALVFLHAVTSPGVIFLRVTPLEVDQVHGELRRLLREQTEGTLKKSYCVVESHRYRIRQLPYKQTPTEEEPEN